MWKLKKASWKYRADWWFPGTVGKGKMCKGSQMVHTFSCKINKFWGYIVQNGDYS